MARLSPSGLPSPQVALALEAMATRFELLIWDDADPTRLRAAGEEALAEIVRAERRLSRFRPTSEIAWVNAAAGGEPARLSPPVFDLVARSIDLARLTGGAFDPTVGPLLRAWGFRGAPAAGSEDVRRARELVGAARITLDAALRTVLLPEPGMELDLGGIGKGAAIDDAVALLREAGVRTALLHGGTSTIHTVGDAPDGGAWRVGWHVPGEEHPRVVELGGGRPALAVSAPHGRTSGAPGQRRGHVVDPRSGTPSEAASSAAVSGPTSTLCDALSTALLVLGPDGAPLLARHFPGYRAAVVGRSPAQSSGKS
jgi:thiamine biosynthesis lipoprotein